MTQNVVTYTVVVTTENKDMKLLPYMTASLKFEIERHEDVLKVANAALRWKPRPKQIAPDIRAKALADMNRPKQADDNKDEGKNGKPKDSTQYSVPSTQSAEQPKQDSTLATSGGTASGLKPEDWKARTEKNAGKDGKPAETGAKQGPKAIAGGHEPPGRPLSPQEAKQHKEHHESSRLWIADGNFVRPVDVKIIATDGTMTEVRGKDISEGMEVVIGESIASDADNDTTNPFMPKLMRPNPNKPKDSGTASK
jgi:HlyD family secretion protein